MVLMVLVLIVVLMVLVQIVVPMVLMNQATVKLSFFRPDHPDQVLVGCCERSILD